MDFWKILYTVDGVLFIFTALTVLYMLFFTITSMMAHQREHYPRPIIRTGLLS